MWTSFLIQHGWPYDALSLVYLYFVAATCCRRCTQGPTTLLSLILSPRLVARIQTGLNSCDWSRRQNFAAAKMIFIKLTVSHKANCCGDLSPRRVAAGQHSLTSVERPFNLRSDFVNVWRKARLEGYIYLWLMYASASIVYSDLSDDLMFVSRSCLAFSIIPRLIQTRRCHCLRLKDVLKFQASSCSAG